MPPTKASAIRVYKSFMSKCTNKKKCKSIVVKGATKVCVKVVKKRLPMIPRKKATTVCKKKVIQLIKQAGGGRTKSGKTCCKCSGGKYWGTSMNCAIGVETGKIPCCKKVGGGRIRNSIIAKIDKYAQERKKEGEKQMIKAYNDCKRVRSAKECLDGIIAGITMGCNIAPEPYVKQMAAKSGIKYDRNRARLCTKVTKKPIAAVMRLLKK